MEPGSIGCSTAGTGSSPPTAFPGASRPGPARPPTRTEPALAAARSSRLALDGSYPHTLATGQDSPSGVAAGPCSSSGADHGAHTAALTSPGAASRSCG